MRYFILWCGILLCLSCNTISEKTDFSPLFSFTNEIMRLKNINPGILKTVSRNGEVKQQTTTVDWKKELEFFVDAEINFPRFQDSYTVEKYVSGTKEVITYVSSSPDIKAKKVQYIFNNGICDMIYIQRWDFDRFNKSSQEMYYQPGVRYEINGTQNIRKLAETKYKVVGKFIEGTSWQNWRFQLNIGTEILPFTIKIGENKAVIINGKEEIKISGISANKDTVIMNMPVFNSEIRFVYSDENTLHGWWYNFAKGDYKVPVIGQKGELPRFETPQESKPLDFSGKWEVAFSPGTEDQYPAIGVFDQAGDNITGTFLTETGDYRFLEGKVNGNTMLLSCFDGAHAFLFKAEMNDKGELNGKFFSGKHWQEPWTAKRNENASLALPETLTYLLDSTADFVFSFPDLDSNMVSNKDDKYDGKVILVQIMGSWCPNCMDETAYLNEIYKKHHQQGLEIISLCFEGSKDFDKAVTNVTKFKEHFGSPYDYLIAGTACKPCASKALPMLNDILSYPTMIFIDTRGKVRKIHTGFYGPGTGPYYEMYVEKTNAFIAQLLAGK